MELSSLTRSPLLIEQMPVPVGWPTRIGYPPPGIIRKTAYPAGQAPTATSEKKHKKRKKKSEKHKHKKGVKEALSYARFDDEYPDTPEGRKLAQAHAWQFPNKRIKVGKRIIRY